MGGRARLLLVTLSLLLLGVVPVSAEPVETVESYDIPWGVLNVIKSSEGVDIPFHSLILEQEYPQYSFNYSVETDGWLEISLFPVNDDRPEILVDGEEVYTLKTPFWRQLVYTGELVVLTLSPYEHLNRTFQNIQDDTMITIWEVYSWEDLRGDVVFSLEPREEIDPGFTWSPEVPVGEASLTFRPDWEYHDGIEYNWVIEGGDVYLESESTRLITPVLEVGAYLVSLTVTDDFGYSDSLTKAVSIEVDPVDALYDPALTEITVKDIQCPSSAGVNELVDMVFSLDFSAPVPRDVRVELVDASTGESLCTLEDHVNGEGTEYYSLSIATSTDAAPMSISVEPSFLNGEEWVTAVGSSFVIQLTAPVEATGGIPGFPVAALIMGLVGVVLLKRRLLVRVIPSPC